MIFLLLLPIILLAQRIVSKDSTCGVNYANKICPGIQCCSSEGKCGKTFSHCKKCDERFGRLCGQPITPLPLTKDGRCGPGVGGYQKCGNDQCCSKDGYCGLSRLHCDKCDLEFGLGCRFAKSQASPSPGTESWYRNSYVPGSQYSGSPYYNTYVPGSQYTNPYAPESPYAASYGPPTTGVNGG